MLKIKCEKEQELDINGIRVSVWDGEQYFWLHIPWKAFDDKQKCEAEILESIEKVCKSGRKLQPTDNRTWEERFPEAAEFNKRDKQGLPYLEIHFWKDGGVGSKRIPHDKMNMDYIQPIIDKRLYDEGHRTTWEYAVRYLKSGCWVFERFRTLEDALTML